MESSGVEWSGPCRSEKKETQGVSASGGAVGCVSSHRGFVPSDHSDWEVMPSHHETTESTGFTVPLPHYRTTKQDPPRPGCAAGR